MSYNNIHNDLKIVDRGLVERILEQGQKLRNSMIGSILKNDPFNTEIIYNKHFNTPQTSRSEICDLKQIGSLTTLDEKRLDAFVKGEYMTKEEEKLALDTLRSLSAPDLCLTAEKTLNSPWAGSCKCYTCEIYNSNNAYCDLKRKHETADDANLYPVSEVTRDIQEKYRNENNSLLKYVDSLKVSVNSLVLNETGIQRISVNDDKKVPHSLSHSYFLEYQVPDFLVNKSNSKSKVNSGLENNYVRLCSRKEKELINFKQVTIHDIKNLDKCDLNVFDIRFKISYRTAKQKHACTLGFAKFNLGNFLKSKNLNCNRGLSVFLNEKSPIVVGTLKVAFLLGCGRLYFGQEFIDAINSTNRNSVVLDSDDSASQVANENVCRKTLENGGSSEEAIHTSRNYINKPNEKLLRYDEVPVNRYSVQDQAKNTIHRNSARPSSYFKKHDIPNAVSTCRSHSEYVPSPKKLTETKKVQTERQNSSEQGRLPSNITRVPTKPYINVPESRVLKPQINDDEKQILFGFIYISEAQYLSKRINSYVTCRPFCQSETSSSKLVTDSGNPVFNFCQLIPLIFEDDLLLCLRENFMVVEFWQKTDETDLVIGLAKIPLHQFYLAYRNPVILKYLSKNQFPVIGTDWWEPIYHIEEDNILGQVQILVALGTEQQITHLKSERGFSKAGVRAKFTSPKLPESKDAIQNKTGAVNVGTANLIRKTNEKDDIRVVSKLREGIKYKSSYKGYNSSRQIFESGEQSKRDQGVNVDISPPKNIVEKFDVGTQSTLEMDKRTGKDGTEKANPTQEMFGTFLDQLLSQRQRNISVENSTNTDAQTRQDTTNVVTDSCKSLEQAQGNTNIELRKTTDLLDSLQKALSLDGVPDVSKALKKSDHFRARVVINSANHLPVRKKCKSKKSRRNSIKNEENVLPSCYVTFEALSEAELKITPVISKSVSPVWSYDCDVNLPADLLTNSQRRLIFKIWRKSTNTNLQPNMQTDVVLGFAAVDLTVLVSGFPNVQGWFNIIDFTGKCNGQINIHITPLENLSKYDLQKDKCSCEVPMENAKAEEPKAVESETEPSDLLSRALKRKFTELDEITQRLRLRLSKVTSEDSDASSDGGAVDEFENDINTLCIEEDFDLINFEEEARKLNANHIKERVESGESSSSNLHGLLSINDEEKGVKEDDFMQDVNEKTASNWETTDSASEESTKGREKELRTLDKHLQEGKQKIDTLLEKLTLLSADANTPFTSRYVSGCSINNDINSLHIDTEAILKELDHTSRPNIQSSSSFDPLSFQQLYGGPAYSNSQKTSSSNTPLVSNSDTSLITNFSECRPAPDGQGNASGDK